MKIAPDHAALGAATARLREFQRADAVNKPAHYTMGAAEGVRTPDPHEFIKHFKPIMRPTLVRRDGEISLRLMDQEGHMFCQILSERDMAELRLSIAVIDEAIAREKLNPRG
jgi:hypothetical protein